MAAETVSASLMAAAGDNGDVYIGPQGEGLNSSSSSSSAAATARRKYSSSSVESGIGLSHPSLIGPGHNQNHNHEPLTPTRRFSGGSNSLDSQVEVCGGHQNRSSSKQSGKQVHQQLSVPENKKSGRNRPASLSPFRFKSKESSRRSYAADVYDAAPEDQQPLLGSSSCSKQPINSSSEHGGVMAAECPTPGSAGSSSNSSSSTSSSIFSWRKKNPRRSNSSSMFSSLSRSVASPSSPPTGVGTGTNHPPPPPTTSSGRQHSSRRGSQPAGFSLPQLVRRSLQPLISSSPSTDAEDPHSDSVSKLRYMKCKQVKFNLQNIASLSLKADEKFFSFFQSFHFISKVLNGRKKGLAIETSSVCDFKLRKIRT